MNTGKNEMSNDEFLEIAEKELEKMSQEEADESQLLEQNEINNKIDDAFVQLQSAEAEHQKMMELKKIKFQKIQLDKKFKKNKRKRKLVKKQKRHSKRK